MRRDLKDIFWPDFKHEELFDLKHDPYETRNLAADPAHSKTLETMRQRFAELKAQAR